MTLSSDQRWMAEQVVHLAKQVMTSTKWRHDIKAAQVQEILTACHVGFVNYLHGVGPAKENKPE
jgi:hypothetical protein